MISRSMKLFRRCNDLDGVDLTTKCREREMMVQRKAFMVLCSREFSHTDTLQHIGRLMGVDHSTVHHHKRNDHWLGAKGYELENYYYHKFKRLISIDSESDRIRANMLLGVL